MPPPPPPTDFRSCRTWCWHRCFHDCCAFRRPPHLRDQPVDYLGFVGVFVTKLLLEVCGAAGAVWGCGEVIHLRTETTNELFRYLSIATFCVFLVRLYWHAKHWLEHEHDFPYVKIHHRRQHWIHFVQVFSAKLLLQVCGAAGAVWGTSEAIGWRTDASNEAWRTAAIVTGNLFFLRWVMEIMSYCLLCQRCTRLKDKIEDEESKHDQARNADAQTNANPSSTSDKVLLCLLKAIDWNQSLTVKFILEVCGAAGAVWGFFEVIELRTADNSETVWRPVALTVGAIFGVRWLWHTVHCLCFDSGLVPLVTEPMTLQKRSSVQLSDRRLHVSDSFRRLSLRVMHSALRVKQKDSFEEGNENDPEVPSNNTMRRDDNDDNDDKEEPSNRSIDHVELGEVEEVRVPSDLRLIVTSDTKESYHSCD